MTPFSSLLRHLPYKHEVPFILPRISYDFDINRSLPEKRNNLLGVSLQHKYSVAHYPTGASKWNPIEHRLFSEISKNWAGCPLENHLTILNYARTTTTTTGLRVRAHLVRRHYKKGVKITDAQLRELKITTDDDLPRWNYTIGTT